MYKFVQYIYEGEESNNMILLTSKYNGDLDRAWQVCEIKQTIR